MVKSYKLINLDCANCANKLERAISKVKGVNSVNIAFMTLRMELDIAEDIWDSVFADVQKVIVKYEPNVVVKRC